MPLASFMFEVGQWDIAAMASQKIYFLGIHVNRMNGDQVRSQQAQTMQSLERPHAMLPNAFGDFVSGFMQVDMNRHVELRGQRCDPLEDKVADGVRRMRRQGKRHQRVVAPRIPHGKALGEIVLGIGGVGRGKFEDRHAQHGPNAGIAGRFGGSAGKEVHVVEAGDAPAQHFPRRQTRAVADEVGRDELALGGPDALVQPTHQRQVVGVPAQQGHGRVRMEIDQTRHEDLSGQVHVFTRGIGSAGIGSRQERHDATVVDR